MVDGAELQQKASARRERIGIFGGTKTLTGRRSQKGKVFNRRNQKSPVSGAQARPTTTSGTQFPRGAATQTVNGVTTLVNFGDEDDDE